jgi:hypothetical protein
MTVSFESAQDVVLSTFRPAGSHHLPTVPRPAVPGGARHRAPDTGEIRIVAADDCARRGRHAAPEVSQRLGAHVPAAPATPAATAATDAPGHDPLDWLGFRFTAG